MAGVHDTIEPKRECEKFRMNIIMSAQTARRLSWSIAVLSVLLVIVGLVISVLALIVSGQGVTFSHQYFTPVLTITYCVVGALVASRHPCNPIGWMFCAIGFLSALNMLSTGYALYDELAMKTGSLPGAAFARWLTYWIWIPNILLPITFTVAPVPGWKALIHTLASRRLGSRTGHRSVHVQRGFLPGTVGRHGTYRVQSLMELRVAQRS